MLRHLFAIAVLPFSVTVLVPVWLARRNGIALEVGSSPLEWALLFFLINAGYIPLLEEPLLRQRFGEEYREYCRHVPRLVPRLRPWVPPAR